MVINTHTQQVVRPGCKLTLGSTTRPSTETERPVMVMPSLAPTFEVLGKHQNIVELKPEHPNVIKIGLICEKAALTGNVPDIAGYTTIQATQACDAFEHYRAKIHPGCKGDIASRLPQLVSQYDVDYARTNSKNLVLIDINDRYHDGGGDRSLPAQSRPRSQRPHPPPFQGNRPVGGRADIVFIRTPKRGGLALQNIKAGASVYGGYGSRYPDCLGAHCGTGSVGDDYDMDPTFRYSDFEA